MTTQIQKPEYFLTAECESLRAVGCFGNPRADTLREADVCRLISVQTLVVLDMLGFSNPEAERCDD